jgi:hypothetical protein
MGEKMRCYCCNRALSDYEATRRSVNTGDFMDMCNKCYGTISGEVLALERADLYHEEDDEDNLWCLDSDESLIVENKLLDE